MFFLLKKKIRYKRMKEKKMLLKELQFCGWRLSVLVKTQAGIFPSEF